MVRTSGSCAVRSILILFPCSTTVKPSRAWNRNSSLLSCIQSSSPTTALPITIEPMAALTPAMIAFRRIVAPVPRALIATYMTPVIRIPIPITISLFSSIVHGSEPRNALITTVRA